MKAIFYSVVIVLLMAIAFSYPTSPWFSSPFSYPTAARNILNTVSNVESAQHVFYTPALTTDGLSLSLQSYTSGSSIAASSIIFPQTVSEVTLTILNTKVLLSYKIGAAFWVRLLQKSNLTTSSIRSVTNLVGGVYLSVHDAFLQH